MFIPSSDADSFRGCTIRTIYVSVLVSFETFQTFPKTADNVIEQKSKGHIDVLTSTGVTEAFHEVDDTNSQNIIQALVQPPSRAVFKVGLNIDRFNQLKKKTQSTAKIQGNPNLSLSNIRKN